MLLWGGFFMKIVRLFLFFTLFFSCDLLGKLPLIPHAMSSKIESIAETAYDFLGVEDEAYASMSPENEAFIRAILQEMGIKRKVIIRRFSNKRLKSMARNACAIDCGLIVYLVFDEAYFDSLTQGEKEYLARHEVAHLQRLHTPIKILATSAILVGLKQINDLVQNWLVKKEIPVNLEYTTYIYRFRGRPSLRKISLFLVLNSFLKSEISRICEYDADVTGARYLDNVDDAIMFIDSRIKDETDPPSRFFLKRIINKLRDFWAESFASHPSWEQRKAVMMRLKENKQISLWRLLMQHFYHNLSFDYNPFRKKNVA